jgi:hypothetical protein
MSHRPTQGQHWAQKQAGLLLLQQDPLAHWMAWVFCSCWPAVAAPPLLMLAALLTA